MKIDILCTDGSPIGVTLKDIWGEGYRGIGLGGSEYALVTMCEEWHKAGHNVVLYNNPITPMGSPFEQRNMGSFNPGEDRDVLITFRSPNPRSAGSKGLKVWWSCDQETIGDFAQFSHSMDKIVCISPRHAQYFSQRYGINGVSVIDIPVRLGDYEDAGEVEKVPNRLVFTSVPARGLDNLFRMYPVIQQFVPEVSLVITSDYRLWGVPASNEQYISMWISRSNVSYLGAISRRQLIIEQLKSQITLYPCNYDELFCVSVAESQVAGSYTITSNCGALPTTNMGKVIEADVNAACNDQLFINETVRLLNNPEELKKLQDELKQKAKERFNPSRILNEWDEKVFK